MDEFWKNASQIIQSLGGVLVVWIAYQQWKIKNDLRSNSADTAKIPSIVADKIDSATQEVKQENVKTVAKVSNDASLLAKIVANKSEKTAEGVAQIALQASDKVVGELKAVANHLDIALLAKTMADENMRQLQQHAVILEDHGRQLFDVDTKLNRIIELVQPQDNHQEA